MTRRFSDRTRCWAVWLGLSFAFWAAPVAAQDIEAAAGVIGRPVPQGYLDQVRDGATFEIRRGWTVRTALAAATGSAVTGTFPVLLLPVYFADSPAPPIPAQEIARVLFDGPNPLGTLSEYFGEASGGALDVQGDVAPWFKSSLTVAQVRGNDFGLGSDARVGELLVEALEAADVLFDFTEFDNDGPDGVPNSGDDDGFVDAFAMEFLEAQLTCQGQGPTIWGHRWVVSGWMGEPFQSDDLGVNGEPIQADDYFTQAAVHCDGRVQNLVVFAHEFGHILGLPDLYDRTEGRFASLRNWVVGCWSIMAAGQWGCGPALAGGRWDRPTFFSPWEKQELGWDAAAIEVPAGQLDAEYELEPAESSGQFLVVDLSGTERLLIEYRDGSSFDVNLPGTGVAVYHVDDKNTHPRQRCRSCGQRYRVALVEADDNASLRTIEGRGGSRGEAGDLFSDPDSRLSNVTRPSTRLNSGAPTDVTIYAMTVANGRARIRLSTGVVAMESLLGPFLDGGGAAPSTEETDYLDRVGNGNGAYDLGDLRRYLIEHPSALARWEGAR